jgi:hypothetical protein
MTAISQITTEKPENPADAKAWEEAVERSRDAGIQWERPAGNTQTAEQIIDANPLLKNLGGRGDRGEDKDNLIAQVGDYTKDPDAAFRAVQVLEHIETFNANGERLASKDIGNGSIDGYTSRNDARHGTEAGRLKDFGKDGFASLKGELDQGASAGNDLQAREQAEKLGILWELPQADTRSAQDIIDANPLLKQLGNQSDVKDMLKERVGDFENDPDAAFRAVQVLDRVAMYDDKSNTLSGGDAFNSRVDGFTKSGEAKHGTEAGRLQDFGKLGFDALAAPKASSEIGSYKDFLKANPDADDASKKIAQYAAILDDQYDAIKGKTGSADMTPEALATYKDKNPQLSTEVKEALDFWSQPGAFALLDNAKSPLEQGLDGKASRGDVQAFLKNAAPTDVGAVGTLLQAVAQGNLLGTVNTDTLGKDVFEHPENYSAEQKAAVLQELKSAQQLIVDGSSAGMWKDDKSQVTIANNVQSHPDPQKLLDDVNQHIALLEKDPEVVKFYNENTLAELPKVLEGSDGLKTALQGTYDDSIKTGDALDKLWDANTKDGKTDQQTALAQFYSSAQSVQEALGIEKPGEIQEAVQNSEHNKDFESFYENTLVSGDRLKELLKTHSFEEATSQFSMEVAMYNAALDPAFTGKFDDTLTANYTTIAQENVFKDATFADLQKAFGKDGGEALDEDKVRALIDEIAKNNPELLMNSDGKVATSDQILGVFRGNWDLLRQGTKSISELGLFNDNSSLKAATGAGVLHGVSGLFMAGITISKGASGAGALTDRQIVDISTGSVQSATLLVEGGIKNVTTQFKTFKDMVELEPDVAKQITTNLSKLENSAKGLGGLAGIAAGAYGIFDGVQSIRKGELVAGGMSITAGSLGAMAGVASAAEGAAGVFQLAGSVVRALPLIAGSLGIATAGVGALALLIPSMIEEGKQETRVNHFADQLSDYVTQYEIDGVENGDIFDVPLEEWPGPEETTIAS